jgi:hypothetical protein
LPVYSIACEFRLENGDSDFFGGDIHLIRYALTVFLSAFLLFQVQPMVAKFILPWFGGSALVWTTCMLFFQVALVAGYGYSHFVSTCLKPRTQWYLHFALVVAAILTLPIRPTPDWKPVDGNFPTWRILWLLTSAVALPFFVLSTTGPLIQKWQSRTHPDRSPFRLFALSNFASLLALVSYPFVVENLLTLDQQSWLWSGMFFVFGMAVVWSGYRFKNEADLQIPQVQALAGKDANPNSNQLKESALNPAMVFLWVLLPMLASVQLLATTNLMTQEIGSHPFLWIVPLALYLISFIVCFDAERWYVRPVFFLGLVITSIAACMVHAGGVDVPAAMQIFGYSAVLFFAAMCCHGELARMKPSHKHLTLFYLLISVGGALGGIFVAIFAPMIFTNYYEFHLSLIVVLLVCTSCLFGPGSFNVARPVRVFQWGIYGLLSLVSLGTMLFVGKTFVDFRKEDREKDVITQVRNEYGVLTVLDESPKTFYSKRKLTNGQISHGFQLHTEEKQNLASSYYGPSSGIGRAVRYFQETGDAEADKGIRIGAIGLGTGTMASWARSVDTVHFFEINPAVKTVAETDFTYLKICEGKASVTLGDARVQLEREDADPNVPQYHVLVADAFSSDSIPMHLLTLEAVQLYRDRTLSKGIIAIHTSNRYLVLENVVRIIAEKLGLEARVVKDESMSSEYNDSTWVLVTANRDFLESFQMSDIDQSEDVWPNKRYSALWTDDFAPLSPIVEWDWDLDWAQDLRKDWKTEWNRWWSGKKKDD